MLFHMETAAKKKRKWQRLQTMPVQMRADDSPKNAMAKAFGIEIFGSSIMFRLPLLIAVLCIPCCSLADPITSTALCWEELAQFSVAPSDPRWTNVSRINNPAYNGNSSLSQPAFVALPNTDSEVQRALACAVRNNLRVAVKAGGHSFAGYSTISSPGFMINLLNMKRVDWTNDTIVNVESGATWADVYSAFKARGGLWVVTGGLCPSVGVAGFTQGGGVGPSARQFGLAADNLIGATVVLANASRIVHADTEVNSDLLWAMRGGGGAMHDEQ
jgi:hypothetical protein